MSNSSRIACSLAPAYFHHWRSKARISRSRSDSSPVTGCPPDSAARSIAISRANSRLPLTYTAVILAWRSVNFPLIMSQTPDTPGVSRRLAHDQQLGVQAAGAVCFGHAADADHLSGGPQRDALVLGE